MTTVVLDIETNLAHDKIWMIGMYWPESGVTGSVSGEHGESSLRSLTANLERATRLIGHNLLHFDLPVLKNVLGWEPDESVEIMDTLVLARLVNPSIVGGNTLKACAERAGLSQKQDFDVSDFDAGWTPEMQEYCIADCKANWDVYNHLMSEYDKLGFSGEALALEHEVSRIVRIQEDNGFLFDWQGATVLYNKQKGRMNEINTILQETFPPIIHERWSEITGKKLKDQVEEFNVGSRQQIARRLATKGAVWKRVTEKGTAIVDEVTLADNAHVPEAAMVLEYLTLSKRSSMIHRWLNEYGNDHRLHGYVNTCGAVTGRMTHSRPNMAQVPKEADYRRFFIVPEGTKLVGCDASGLELRMLAHYMKDEAFTYEILDGDIHTANQKAFNCSTRDQAKTLIYALLYGAGDAKLGSEAGGNANLGRQLRDNYESNWPAYRDLVERIKKLAKNGTIPGLDGRRIHVRSEHAALNSLLQSAGAIVMKKALALAVSELDKQDLPYKMVANVHDEMQLEVPTEYAEQVGVCVRDSIRNAGLALGLRCPLDAEYMIGDSWAETH